MTQEDKELLLKDLSARLPYGVMLRHKNVDGNYKLVSVFNDGSGRIGVSQNDIPLTPTSIDVCQPYLRPLSSMTEDEVKQYYKIRTGEDRNKPLGELDAELFDFYHKSHIDYRGLIPMGLALEAPEGMYKF